MITKDNSVFFEVSIVFLLLILFIHSFILLCFSLSKRIHSLKNRGDVIHFSKFIRHAQK